MVKEELTVVLVLDERVVEKGVVTEVDDVEDVINEFVCIGDVVVPEVEVRVIIVEVVEEVEVVVGVLLVVDNVGTEEVVVGVFVMVVDTVEGVVFVEDGVVETVWEVVFSVKVAVVDDGPVVETVVGETVVVSPQIVEQHCTLILYLEHSGPRRFGSRHASPIFTSHFETEFGAIAFESATSHSIWLAISFSEQISYPEFVSLSKGLFSSLDVILEGLWCSSL